MLPSNTTKLGRILLFIVSLLQVLLHQRMKSFGFVVLGPTISREQRIWKKIQQFPVVDVPTITTIRKTTTNTNNVILLHNNIPSQPLSDPKHVETVLFIECGFGADAHGQNVTKAAVRACRNAIEFNQIPSLTQIIPGGKEEMKLDVLLAIPNKYCNDINLDTVRRCFPYGNIHFQIQNGGMIASNGKIIETMGDTNDDMIIVCAAITVGY